MNQDYGKNIEVVKMVSEARQYSIMDDLSMLVKTKLASLVVFSSIAGYMIVAGSAFLWADILLLSIGGFFTTGAANILNQVLEKDFDILMRRTQERPLAQGRMRTSAAVLLAGVMCLFGIIALALFNPLTSFLGMVSLILYAFVYTPMKRYSTLAVSVGAIPGALPILIGCTAFEGGISTLALSLFVLQFLWQFPHFWAIGYLGFEDYKRADYRLMPMTDGVIDSQLGKHVFIYSLLLLPVTIFMFYTGMVSSLATVISLIIAGVYIFYSFKFYKSFDTTSAKHTMFASFLYLPVMQLAYWFF